MNVNKFNLFHFQVCAKIVQLVKWGKADWDLEIMLEDT
jgi:hypothetical protein